MGDFDPFRPEFRYEHERREEREVEEALDRAYEARYRLPDGSWDHRKWANDHGEPLDGRSDDE